MGVEIERKYRVRGGGWRSESRRTRQIAQGYLSTDADATVRVRVDDDRGILTVKGRARGLVRSEFEYEIPVEDARKMLEEFCAQRRVEKIRHEVEVGDHLWVVDEFRGANQGLVVAEVELARPDEAFDRPDWLGEEVTGEVRYYNARLAERPYRDWAANEKTTQGESP